MTSAPAPAPGMTPSPAPAPATPAPAPVAQAKGCYPASMPRRFSRDQFVNALTDSVRTLLPGNTQAAAMVSTAVIDQSQFPPDQAINPDSARHQGYVRIDQQVNSRQLSAIYASAKAVANEMTLDAARVNTLLGNCSGLSADNCLRAFIRKAGRVLFRQPLTDDEVAVYVAAGNSSTSAANVARVLASMIASPKFYFVLERGQTVDSGTACAPLTGPELAARLALHLWDSVPDAELNQAADNGTLLNSDTYTAQVNRMLADPKADRAMRSFFRQWFRLDELVALDGKVGNARFDAFAAGFRPLPTSRDAAINEVLDMVSYLAANNGSLQQVLTDRRSFARTNDIATLYKTPVWSGSGTPPTFTEAQRVGLLTRVAFTAQGSTDTTLPIQRGSRILSGLTCQSLPAPAMDQTNAAADLSGVLTTRERTERITEMPGTSCVACHKTSINPWGFAFEHFDSLGRVRSSEVVRNDSGAALGEKPINASVTLKLDGMAERAVTSAAAAQQYVVDSGAFERCFARNQVRYTFGRADTAEDAALVEWLRAQAASGASLRTLFGAIVQRPEFKSIARNP